MPFVAAVSAYSETSEERVTSSPIVTIDCPADECYVVPYMRYEGGFFGEALPGKDVTIIAWCGNRHISRTIRARGQVSHGFTYENGMACDRPVGAFIQVNGIDEGGWYWVKDPDRRIAMAMLIRKDAFQSQSIRRVAPVNPGVPGLLFEPDRSGTASFVKHISTGSVGILPHLQPTPPTRLSDRCGPRLVDEDDPTISPISTPSAIYPSPSATLAEKGLS